MAKFIVGSEYNLTHQGTRTTAYQYAVIECEDVKKAEELAEERWGRNNFWAIRWSQYCEDIEKCNPMAMKVCL